MKFTSADTMTTNKSITKCNKEEIEAIVTTTKTFCRQEQQQYHKIDWIHAISSSSSSSKKTSKSNTNDIIQINWTSCRSLMINWFVQLTEALKLNINTIEITISYIDRCMMKLIEQEQKKNQPSMNTLADVDTFQLLCVTCFYIATKIHEPVCIDPKLLCKMSNNAYTVQEIESMERIILNDLLQWYVNPPTTVTFVQLLLDLLQQSLDTMNLEALILEVTSECHADIESLMEDDPYLFLSTKSSIIAYCTIMNNLELFNTTIDIRTIGYNLAKLIGISNCNDTVIIKIQDQLYENKQNYASNTSKLDKTHQEVNQHTDSCQMVNAKSSLDEQLSKNNVESVVVSKSAKDIVQQHNSPCRISDHI